MRLFSKLFTRGLTTSTLNILGGVIATGFLTISALSFTGVIQIFDSQVNVTFLNYDDQVLQVVKATRGDDVVYPGETPTKPSDTEDNIYVFTGWSAPLTNVRTNLEVKALFSSHTNSFVASFFIDNQEIYKRVVPFGAPLAYEGPNPRYSNDNRFDYQFIGWDLNADGVVDPLPTRMTANVNARAVFIARLNSFLVRFKNHNQQLLSQQTVFYGEEAKYAGDTPFKLPAGGNHFVFKNWYPSPDFVTANLDVIAEFEDGPAVPFIAKNSNLQIGNTQTFGANQFSVNLDILKNLLPYVGQDGNWWIGDMNLEMIAKFVQESTIYPFVNSMGNWNIGDIDTNIPFDVSGIDFPKLGENGNWFIGNLDTNIPAIIPSIGENGNWFIGGYDTNISASEISINELGTPFVAPNGNWWIGPNDIGIPAIGFENLDINLEEFQNIPYIGPNDNWWIGISDTGIAFVESMESFPYIGENDHWWIGEIDTYISAHGQEGETPYPFIGDNGNWYFGETDTGFSALDGSGLITNLLVNADGNWWIGPVDIGIPAIIISVSMTGNWMINQFDTGISFYDTYIIPPYIGINGNYYIGLVDTGITAYGEVSIPEIPVDEEDPDDEVVVDNPEEEEPTYVEQILDTGEYSFGYDFGFGSGATGGTSGSGGSGGTGTGTGGQFQTDICPADMTITYFELEILDIEMLYDGQTISNSSAVLRYDESIFQSGERIVVTFEDMGPKDNPKAMPKDIGQYELRGKLSIVDADNNILKCVYRPNITYIGDLIISPRSISISTETMQKPFDGAPLINHTYTVSGQGLAENHTLVIVFTGSQTEVGASVNFIDWSQLKVLDENNKDVTKNYLIIYNHGMLIVTFAS